ncbi:hypothetical protein BMH32_00185 [Leucobacter sp. OLJS4]|uniref:PASTA domain-containing protein n=1 Tax=unclassified Leucobacter TaxID=2621730 RepID=UPI000C188A6A|nr:MULTISPECIES: PASTA domain-containing protein [unclassified Leucobacter]PII81459.1 hypothetical protein BMH25_13020 [Leucobacter sp. OLCALW19]PII86129.1 hypothetical protein BMH26_13440 [Leucobacter sp. OLTLW20]PII90024.1 hypothetical protein BMH27_11605 [Leucobacter sp. OLAS13]PII97057.1 hypothetical protein BMH29_12290 [Leucobacter sp. OLDS2]PIJ02249.1 hypothetical protein BMH31_12590 [Leucobacter sp. OLIS6]
MTAAQPDPTPTRRAPISGIAALLVGIAAFVFCWVPFLGLGLGAGSIVLGILSVRGGRARGAGIGGLAFGAVAAIPAVVMTIMFIAAFVIALPTGTGASRTAAPPSATASPAPSATSTPSPRTGAEEKAQYEARLKERQEAERAAREEDARKNGVELPDLSGLDGKTAQWRLEDLGLTVRFDGKSGTVLAPVNWTVIGSSPGAGKRAKLGSTVVLRMEKTAEMTPSPTPPGQ